MVQALLQCLSFNHILRFKLIRLGETERKKYMFWLAGRMEVIAAEAVEAKASAEKRAVGASPKPWVARARGAHDA